MPKGFPPHFRENTQKGIRIDVAENGFVVYLRTSDHGEETRIATNTATLWYIITGYLKEPIAPTPGSVTSDIQDL